MPGPPQEGSVRLVRAIYRAPGVPERVEEFAADMEEAKDFWAQVLALPTGSTVSLAVIEKAEWLMERESRAASRNIVALFAAMMRRLKQQRGN